MFRDKTESYLTVLQQNNVEACYGSLGLSLDLSGFLRLSLALSLAFSGSLSLWLSLAFLGSLSLSRFAYKALVWLTRPFLGLGVLKGALGKQKFLD